MRLNHITAPALDLATSIAFYQALGLHLIVRSEHYARFELPDGEATFSLHVVTGPVARENAPQLYFEVLDVDVQVRRMKHAGAVFEQEAEDKPWLWREAWTRDPAGNAICIYHAADMRRYPPWRLDPQPGEKCFHIVFLDDGMLLVRRPATETADDWRALQAEYPTYKTSIGPFDLYSVLALLEFDWPQVFLSSANAIRAFVDSDEKELAL